MASDLSKRLLLSLLGSGGGSAPPVFMNPKLVWPGDSVVEFGAVSLASLNGGSVTRDASGLETWTVGSTALIKGQPLTFTNHMANDTYDVVARPVVVDSTHFTRQTTVTGNAGSSSSSSLGTLRDFGRFTARWVWPYLQGLHKGGLQFLGNLGQNGYLAGQLGPTVDAALLLNPDVVPVEGGLNDIYGGALNDTTTFANIKVLIDKVTAAGKFALVQSVTPVTTAYGLYSPACIATTQSVNSMLQAYCAANPTKMAYVDVFSAWFDGTACNPVYSEDAIHPSAYGAMVAAQAYYAVTSTLFSAPDMLPTAAGASVGVGKYSARVTLGPWSTAGGGTFVNIGSGTLPSGWQAGRSSGTATGTFSVVDPGDSRGCNVTASVIGAAANDKITLWPFANAGITLANLSALFVSAGVSSGLSVGDTIAFGLEVSWTNANDAKVQQFTPTLQTNSSGGFGVVSTMESTESTPSKHPDTSGGYLTLMTGDLKIITGTTGFAVSLDTIFSAASNTAFAYTVRRVTVFKL